MIYSSPHTVNYDLLDWNRTTNPPEPNEQRTFVVRKVRSGSLFGSHPIYV